MTRFAPGDVVTVSEVLHGQTWASFPESVVSDDGAVLATVQAHGTPLSFPDHPFGPHPWSRLATWSGTTVLKLRRTGDWYSVWKFFSPDAEFRFWYVNFEEPVVRRPDGVDVNDLQLDLVVAANGSWRWKDVEDLAPALATGRIDADQLRHVLEAASDVAGLLERDDRWWAPWDAWTPDMGAMPKCEEPGRRRASPRHPTSPDRSAP
jgi:hypothetical protein